MSKQSIAKAARYALRNKVTFYEACDALGIPYTDKRGSTWSDSWHGRVMRSDKKQGASRNKKFVYKGVLKKSDRQKPTLVSGGLPSLGKKK